MKPMPNHRLDVFRTSKPLGASPQGANHGTFQVVMRTVTLFAISSGLTDDGWEHVSVSVRKRNRCPTWEEMCHVKKLFWDEDETVVQFHPGKEYVNNHPYCLHMWKAPYSTELPPTEYIGIAPPIIPATCTPSPLPR